MTFSGLPPLTLPVSAGSALKVLSHLQAGEDPLATLAAQPAMSLELLLAAGEHDLEEGLSRPLGRAVAALGEDLLAAYCLSRSVPGPRESALQALEQHSRQVALLCASAAREGLAATPPEHAYLAGLWHNLGQLALAAQHPGYPGPVADAREAALIAGERRQYGQDHAEVLTQVLDPRLRLPPFLIEALLAHHHPANFLYHLPPLIKLIAEVVAAVAGEPGGPGRLATVLQHAPSPTPLPVALPLPPASLSLALRGLLRAAFAAADCPAPQRMAQASRLLFGRRPPLVFALDGDGALALRNYADPQAEASFVIAPQDTGACLRALREEQTLQLDAAACSAHGSDWLLARWLEAPGLLLQPWRSEDGRGVVVFGDWPLSAEAIEVFSLTQFATLAIGRCEAQLRQERALAASRAAADEAQLASARRLAHEISNPLSVLVNYIGIVEQRNEHDPDLRHQLALMQDEIGRTRRLLSKLGREDGAGAVSVGINEVLLDLRALYGESLFEDRGIRFELQLAEALPAAAMPPDALKQVLLNLLLNAVEAVGDDGRICVATSGDILLDAQPHAEVRIEDNGPGLPRLPGQGLLWPTASGKAEGRSGVGLAVCRDLLQRHGGRLLAKTGNSGGALFQVFVPLKGHTNLSDL